MKKRIVVLLLGMTIFATGCGTDISDNQEQTQTEGGIIEEENIIEDEEKDIEKNSDATNIDDKYVLYVNDTNLMVGKGIKETVYYLIDNGWRTEYEGSDDNDEDYNRTLKEANLESGDVVEYTILKELSSNVRDDRYSYIILKCKIKDGMEKFEDLIVDEVSVATVKEKGRAEADVKIGGIGNDSTNKTIIDTFGEPTYKEEDDFFIMMYYEITNGYTVKFEIFKFEDDIVADNEYRLNVVRILNKNIQEINTEQ